ncbi:LytTR family DNA-binding domain-containing protein [Geobacter sp. SVR]|uniref:LytR/AlgR family response regulator transcription factor n=1 Tax=Geobacter sp. SVR TaxID=2495594 RepID=UPI00143EFDA3|nr:LytTR family DNA-binding domain-containing protein [Geobacter sp. SVR]BCS53509.1 sensory transduction protein LytT [Geobacter sp. SVR]GCF84294.1 DNA-binding response regulator [Geobacter sp. SVR]
MRISVYIIDDEAPARRELRYLLEQIDGVTILGESSTPSQGLKGIRETRPDMVFLDIQMPGLSGIDLAQMLAELPNSPQIVFATAHHEFAVEAFDVDATDYILKPFTMERVAHSINKAEKSMRSRHGDGHTIGNGFQESAGLAAGKRLLVHKRGKTLPIAPEDILFISRTERETLVHTARETYMSRSSLSALEEVLAPFSFVRVHRNTLVNLKGIIEIIPWFSGSCKLVMNDAARSEVLVSRYNAKDLKERLILSS